ncbi:unnamed protein product, partial [Urochloa humidicola]
MVVAPDLEVALDPVKLVVGDRMQVPKAEEVAVAGHNMVVLLLVVDLAQDLALLCLNRGRLMAMVALLVPGAVAVAAAEGKLQAMRDLVGTEQVVVMDLALVRQTETTTISMYQHMPMRMLLVMVVARAIVKMVGAVVVMAVALGTVMQSL